VDGAFTDDLPHQSRTQRRILKHNNLAGIDTTSARSAS
jgi:hypothetical protein